MFTHISNRLTLMKGASFSCGVTSDRMQSGAERMQGETKISNIMQQPVSHLAATYIVFMKNKQGQCLW